MMVDLLAGYDGRILAESSRDLTTFDSLIGAHRLTCLPQGYANAVPSSSATWTHILRDENPTHARAFLDDVGIKGPNTTYNDELIIPGSGVRRFVYEFLTTASRIFGRFELAGITISGHKLVAAVPQMHIVGTVVSLEGWHLDHGVVNKVLKWVECTNVSEVRSFLGVAGIARRWIKNFSIIVRPLTRLTRKDAPFVWGEEEHEAMEYVKHRVTSAPVLRKIDYELARTITPHDERLTDHGLVIVAVDSSLHGAGWVLYQVDVVEKHPALFGSCTFNEVESRYSQPKLELYGVFRAFKELRHRIWGTYFRLDVDAKSLKQMISSPDLPNAPMTRWVSYLRLFDFYVNHVPATAHQASDGLSRRPPASDDSDESDGEEYLERVLAATELREEIELYAHRIRERRRIEDGALFDSERISTTPCLATLGVTEFGEEALSTLHDESTTTDLDGGTLLSSSPFVLSLTDTDAAFFVPNDFMRRHTPQELCQTYLIAGEEVDLPITEYQYAYVLSPSIISSDPREESGRSPFASRSLYPQNDGVFYSGAGHKFGKKDEESDGQWAEVLGYLKDGSIPPRCASLEQRKKFLSFCSRFMLSGERLWLAQKGKMPRLVITDKTRRKIILAEAHNQCGHRGRDATYTRLAERYYWPNMYDEVSTFVRSCNACQFRSKARPVMTYSPSWSISILRKFHLDTIYMPRGRKKMRYILKAIEPVIGWPEARASRRNTSEAWSKFIYTDIICRFSCIPVFVCDNGPEFKGAVKHLFDKYGIVCILVAPYHPEANGVAERSHQTLVNSILKACGNEPQEWPLYLPGALLAMRTTTSRMTGYTPYYLLYSQNPVFGFDLSDRTWSTLDWFAVKDTDDLIALRLQQITRREKDIGRATEKLNKARAKAVEDYEKRNAGRIQTEMLAVGTLVLVHQTCWTTSTATRARCAGQGHGTEMRGAFAADRVKRFFHRFENQTMTELPALRDRLQPARADETVASITSSYSLSYEFRSIVDGSRCLTIGDLDDEHTVLGNHSIESTNLADLARDAQRVQAWW
ncbi:Transposon Tf2-9 polyprotein [Grifola frondosa]|uniref:Transposon Tf2-9 polyprotein n=1 Tax=Grifola frondosa TaxID=5627 RepID=A0A1C7M0F8_GRIFR|nr:Transposon Tf2-9 polyprotein [Grifola frondosa]